MQQTNVKGAVWGKSGPGFPDFFFKFAPRKMKPKSKADRRSAATGTTKAKAPQRSVRVVPFEGWLTPS